ncbi:MAG: hypothetical protein WDK95_08185 [Syntrophorhabdaceae bacterium]
MKVTLKHISRFTWSGVKRYVNCTDSLGSYYTRSGRLYTGLDSEKEKELSAKLGLDLRPGSDFWSTFRIRITGEDLVLDTSDNMDMLKYLFLKGHKRVRNGIDDNKPTANYVLVNKEEEAVKVNQHAKTKRAAYKTLDKMTVSEMRKALRILGQNSNNVGDEQIEARLNEYVESSPAKFIEKWVENPHRNTEFLIKEAIANNVIRRNKNVYKYGSDTIGHSLEDTIDYLDNPENQEVKTTILNEVEVKK